MIANHFNSKGGDDPLFGRFQPPIRSSEVAAARSRRPRSTPSSRQVLAATARRTSSCSGDINDFEFSETRGSSQGAPAADLLRHCCRQPSATRYVFEGNSQVLDHILLSCDCAAGAASSFDVVHVNAEFADQASDHDPSVARLRLRD